MAKTAKKASALMVLATTDVSAFFQKDQELALHSDDEGNQYITNAGLEAPSSPYTGKVATEAGIPCTASLSHENALAVPCATCEATTLMNIEQAAELDNHVSCVVCGSQIEFELPDEEVTDTASEESEEEIETATDDKDEVEEEIEASEEDEDTDEVEASDEDSDDTEEEASDEDESDESDEIQATDDDDDDDEEDDEDRPLDMVDFGDDEDDEACDMASDEEDAEDFAELEASNEDDDDSEEIEASDEEQEEVADTTDVENGVIDDNLDNDSGKKGKVKLNKKLKEPNRKTNLTRFVDGDKIDPDNNDKNNAKVKDVALASLVDPDAKVELVSMDDNKVGAFVGDICVATMQDDNDNFDLVETASYSNGLGKAVKKVGLLAALTEAGFKPIVIKASEVLANVAKANDAKVNHLVEEASGNYSARLRDCMDIVAAGSIRGMFSKSGVNTLYTAIEAKLASLNVGNSKQIAREILADTLPSYSSSLIEVAHDLSQRDDVAITELRERIADMEGSFTPSVTASVKEDSIVNRLTKPARTSETASTLGNRQPNSNRRFAGLFS